MIKLEGYDIFCNMHIMWYESHMVGETLQSLYEALLHSKSKILIKLCLNSQTYIETPLIDDPVKMLRESDYAKIFNRFLSKNWDADVVRITMSSDFYNIGDWRRENYSNDVKYNVWLESDCLLPEDYFYILENLDIQEPHILSFASRKMWDDSWTIVEHEQIQSDKHQPYDENTIHNSSNWPWNHHDIINQKKLNEINNQSGEPKIKKLDGYKIDGSLAALSSNLPQFIPIDMHFAREDTCMESVMRLKNIPQYHVTNRLKGHNYYHPYKWWNTKTERGSDVYNKYENESLRAYHRFMGTITNN